MTTGYPTLQELFDLSGKVALVTGGAGWLGTASSEALAEAGARVIVASRTLDSCEALAKRLGDQHVAWQLDVADEDAVRATVDRAFDELGSLDVLINNAYSGTSPSREDATGADFMGAYQTGLISYFIASQQMVKRLRETGRGGSIVNIGSMYGVVASYPEAYVGTGVSSPPNYHALKGAVIHLTRHLAVYWAQDDVRVNCISPGPFPPARVSAKDAAFVERLCDRVPMKRMGEPWELKGAIALLASRAGSYITGQNLLIDGGWTAW